MPVATSLLFTVHLTLAVPTVLSETDSLSRATDGLTDDKQYFQNIKYS